MARIATDRLVRHLARSGFMVLKAPPLGDDHSATAHLPAHDEP